MGLVSAELSNSSLRAEALVVRRARSLPIGHSRQAKT